MESKVAPSLVDITPTKDELVGGWKGKIEMDGYRRVILPLSSSHRSSLACSSSSSFFSLSRTPSDWFLLALGPPLLSLAFSVGVRCMRCRAGWALQAASEIQDLMCRVHSWRFVLGINTKGKLALWKLLIARLSSPCASQLQRERKHRKHLSRTIYSEVVASCT